MVQKKQKKGQRRKRNAKPSPQKHPQILQSNLAVLQSIAKRKHHVEQKMHCFVSMTAMLLLIFTNFLGAILLIPFLLFFSGFSQYALILIFAVAFGMIFNLMIHSIEHLGDKHHLIAGVVVPFFALLDVVILFTLLEKIKDALKISITYNYTLIVVLFIVAFLVPYIIDIVRGKHRFRMVH